MGYKLKGYPLMLAVECGAVARRHKGHVDRVLFEVDSKDDGKKLAGQLQNVYTDNAGLYDTYDGWRDFSLKFEAPHRVGEVVKDFNGAIAEYIEDHPEEFGYVVNKPNPDLGDDDDEDDTGGDNAKTETETMDYTTYIIIGAAVLIIIILLLWER